MNMHKNTRLTPHHRQQPSAADWQKSAVIWMKPYKKAV